MHIKLKMRDVFYNNGITNIFWATLKTYDTIYEEEDNNLVIKENEIKLFLKPFMLEIFGDESDIKDWYKKVSYYLIDKALYKTKRVIYDPNRGELQEGYSLKIMPFAIRTWGTSIGSRYISGPSIWKKLTFSDINNVKKAIENYEKKTGKNLKTLAKENLFKEKWENEGVYIQINKQNIIDNLLNNRNEFEKGDNRCEICGNKYTKYKNKNKFKRDTSVLPTIIGLDYAGFKDLKIGENIVCAFCDLVLRYNFFWTFYAKTDKSVVLHLSIPDLIVLFKLKYDLFEIKMEDIVDENIKQSTNIPYQGFYLSSPERALLSLAFFTFKKIKGKSNENRLSYFGRIKDFIQISGILFKSEGIYEFIEYHKLSKFLDFLNSLSDINALISPFNTNAFILKEGKNTNLYEKNFLLNLLNFKPISKILADISFLKISENLNKVTFSRGFEEMIIIFYKFLNEEDTMDKDILDKIHKYGWAIGTLAKALDEKGIFYELRDAKRKEQLIKVLRDFSYKIINKTDNLKEKFNKAALSVFTNIDQEIINILSEEEKRWEEIRDLLSFFAVNNYLKNFNTEINSVKNN